MAEQQGVGSGVSGAGHSHPGPSQYIAIALILGALTVVEVLLYVFREQLTQRVTTPALIALTVLKFALVGLWFMHLRFDHPLLRRLFLGCLILAGIVFAVVAADWYLSSLGPGF